MQAQLKVKALCADRTPAVSNSSPGCSDPAACWPQLLNIAGLITVPVKGGVAFPGQGASSGHCKRAFRRSLALG